MSGRVVNERPFVWENVALYLLLCTAGAVGMSRPRIMGEAADVLQLTSLALVVWTTGVIGARLVRLGARGWVLYVLGLGAWYLPLLLLQATAWALRWRLE